MRCGPRSASRAGPPPDRFLVGLAVLSLLSEVAGERPLICVVDDEQWLDRASAQALGFVARRLAADPVGLVFAAREPGEELAGLPELVVEGLRDDRCAGAAGLGAGRAAGCAGPGPDHRRDAGQSAGAAGAAARADPGGAGGRVRAARRGAADGPDRGQLPPAAGRPAGADPAAAAGWRRPTRPATGRWCGGRPGGWASRSRRRAPAVEAGLVEFGARVRFRHPLVRSAAYRSASLAEQQQVHAALAEVTDPQADPDRRAWHRAQAAAGPDEDVAAELERSAGRAQARGGLAAAAAFLERSVLLTADPARHAGARAGRGAGQHAGRRVRQGPGTAGHGGGRAAG